MKTRNGFTLIEMVCVIALIGLVAVATGVMLFGAGAKARAATTETRFDKLQNEVTQAFAATKDLQTYSIDDASVCLNRFLDTSAKLTAVSGSVDTNSEEFTTNYKDGFQNQVRVLITNKSLDGLGQPGNNDGNDTEMRVFIISSGDNGRTTDDLTGETLDSDDCCVVVQCVNGDVTTGYFGFSDKNCAQFKSTEMLSPRQSSLNLLNCWVNV